ncbi:hypothetical protein C8N35_1011073 [Breoghania corrubedonensis]|uniref:Uncharacterized protein n=1 Tax=Breoghania corrubedonensis TaxID=665038 RepID=A0A2T5VH01_9HYPH|nr:hypothetical protein C8N35_1011073 [Breoghania corrubedonensis]
MDTENPKPLTRTSGPTSPLREEVIALPTRVERGARGGGHGERASHVTLPPRLRPFPVIRNEHLPHTGPGGSMRAC